MKPFMHLQNFLKPIKAEKLSAKPFLNAGFTMIETFVAVTILMMVVVGPLTLAMRSLNSASLAKDKMAAYFLAQDTIEYIRNIRDDLSLAGTPIDFFDGVMQPCQAELGAHPQCIIDTTIKDTGDAIDHCAWETCPFLDYNKQKNSYLYRPAGVPADDPDWEQSPFKRGVKITLLPVENNGLEQQEMSIKVTVSWNSQGFGPQEIILRDTLLNWQ